MKIKMKVTSIFLAFALFCSIFSLDAFAELKGNPIVEDENGRVCKQIKARFERVSKDINGSEIPIKCKIKANSSCDHRVIYVYNIPELLQGEDKIEGSILHLYWQMLGEARKTLTNAALKSKKTKKDVMVTYKKLLEDKLKDKGYCKQLASEFGISVDELISDVTDITAPTVPGNILGRVFVRTLQAISDEKIDPLTAALLTYSDSLHCINNKRVQLAREKEDNIKLTLRLLFKCITNSNRLWRGQNVLITAIDKRDFCPWLVWNRNRSNECAWVGFTNINGLIKEAPTVERHSKLDRRMYNLSKIYKALTLEDGQINFDLLGKCLSSGMSIEELLTSSLTKTNLLVSVNKEVQNEEMMYIYPNVIFNYHIFCNK